MARPKKVNIETFSQYDKLHTRKEKMMCGVEMTVLYPIKETEKSFVSVEVWAHCARKFQEKKKDGFNLEVNIPILSDEKAIEFLDKNAWSDWVQREINDKDSDMIETVDMLKKLFPDKEAVFFYELDSLLSTYCGGTFIAYKDGEIRQPSETTLERRKYYNRKYYRFCTDEPCKKMCDRWTNETNEELKKQYLTEYHKFEMDYVYEHYNLIETFIKLGENAVCYPVAFTENTAEWSKEKYGKLIDYAHAGEIYFIATADKVYFEIKRHF